MLVPPDYFLQAKYCRGVGRYTDDGLVYPLAWRVAAVEYGVAFGGLKGVDIKFSTRVDAELAIAGVMELQIMCQSQLKSIDDDTLLRALTKYLRW